jgi:hypothetical protein
MLCDASRVMDPCIVGGADSGRILGTGIKHPSEAGEPLFAWSQFGRFELTDLAAEEGAETEVDWR